MVAKLESERLSQRAINNNFDPWYDNNSGLKLAALNVRYLKKHFIDIKNVMKEMVYAAEKSI